MIKLPIVGACYKMQAKSMSAENCINFYPQVIQYPNGSRVSALMPREGLVSAFQGDTASVRSLFVLSNGNMLAVIGKKLYHTTAKSFNLQLVGNAEDKITGLGSVSVADNGNVAMIVNGTYTYTLDLKTLALTRLSGSNIPRATFVAFLDGRFIFNKAGTGQFVWSNLYSQIIDPLSFATAEASPDPITAIISFNRELWMFGTQTVERYYSTGNNDLPYARLSGGTMAFGCVAPNSIGRFTGGFIWLAVSEFGGNQIVISDGGAPSRVSTHAIEEQLDSYSRVDDAISFAYQREGHVFYVLSFPSANVTWCYDASTSLWTQRSWTNALGEHERYRAHCHAYFRDEHYVGDWQNGRIYRLDKNVHTDNGDIITLERTCPIVSTDGKLTRFNKLEIVCEVGSELYFEQKITKVYAAWDAAWISNNEIIQFGSGEATNYLATKTTLSGIQYTATKINAIPEYMRYIFPKGLFASADGDTLLFAYNEEGEHATLYGVNKVAGSYSEQITFDPEITSAVQRAALSPDAEYLVLSFITGKAVYKRNILGNYDLLNDDELFSAFATDCRFSFDSEKIAGVDSNNYLVIYDFNAGSPILEYSTKIVGFDTGGPQDIKWLDATNIIVSMYGSDDNKYYLLKGTIADDELTISTVMETPFQAQFSISEDGTKIECHQENQIIVFDYDVVTNSVSNSVQSQLERVLINQVGSISPDGTKLLASSFVETQIGVNIYQVDPDNSINILI